MPIRSSQISSGEPPSTGTLTFSRSAICSRRLLNICNDRNGPTHPRITHDLVVASCRRYFRRGREKHPNSIFRLINQGAGALRRSTGSSRLASPMPPRCLVGHRQSQESWELGCPEQFADLSLASTDAVQKINEGYERDRVSKLRAHGGRRCSIRQGPVGKVGYVSTLLNPEYSWLTITRSSQCDIVRRF